jgi:outer membrane protein OmpA-like peptidoglycan-associated protein
VVYEYQDLATSDTISVPLDVEGVNEYTKVVRVTPSDISLSEGVVVDGDILALSKLEDPTNIDLETDNISNEIEIPAEDTSTDLEVANETLPVEEVEKHIVFYKSVYYKSSSSDLNKASKNILNELIKILKDNPEWNVNSIGHTDLTGTAKSNQILSVLRAESVKTYLYNRGIEFNRIKAYGMGENQPVAEDNYDDGVDDTIGKDANRRVEIQLIK